MSYWEGGGRDLTVNYGDTLSGELIHDYDPPVQWGGWLCMVWLLY